ncbi:MAG: DUF1566 domain-containing protein [Thermodesulfovibrionales bacterium]
MDGKVLKIKSILFFYILFTFVTYLSTLGGSSACASVAILFWNEPPTNDDGSPVTDLAGYKVYYGTSSRNYSECINVGNVKNYTVNNLKEGLTYYFAVTAYDIFGNESGYSNEAIKTIPVETSQEIPIEIPSEASSIKIPTTGQVVSYAVGDDGYIQSGIDWPEPRFIDNGDGTITDNLTGLMWLKDGGCLKKKKWSNSLDTIAYFNNNPEYYNCMEYTANYSDWRLPDVKELESLINYGVPNSAEWLNSQGFMNMNSFYYWSSTTHQANYRYAWIVKMSNGRKIRYLKSYGYYNILAVRNGDTEGFYEIAKTGQVVSYAVGDDGYIQSGIDWPEPRFIDNGDGTITDNLTGLMWLKDGGCLKKKKWSNSLDTIAYFNNNPEYYNCMEYTANYSDWRLPDVKELESLINYGVPNSAEWLNSQGFMNMNSFYYWSSTTHQANYRYAWIVKMSNGRREYDLKFNRYYILPVRGN